MTTKPVLIHTDEFKTQIESNQSVVSHTFRTVAFLCVVFPSNKENQLVAH